MLLNVYLKVCHTGSILGNVVRVVLYKHHIAFRSEEYIDISLKYIGQEVWYYLLSMATKWLHWLIAFELTN